MCDKKVEGSQGEGSFTRGDKRGWGTADSSEHGTRKRILGTTKVLCRFGPRIDPMKRLRGHLKVQPSRVRRDTWGATCGEKRTQNTEESKVGAEDRENPVNSNRRK